MKLPIRMVYALALIAFVQSAALAAIVFDRIRLLQTGREIALPIVPVDPRDLFRGEYVELGYAVAQVPARLIEGPPPEPNAAFHVTRGKTRDGSWATVKLTRDGPQESDSERIVLKGRSRFGRLSVDAGNANAVNSVRYGIEQYFVPQGEGPRLEALARDKKLAARIAVNKSGNAAIKGLLIDGVLQYEEPLF